MILSLVLFVPKKHLKVYMTEYCYSIKLNEGA